MMGAALPDTTTWPAQDTERVDACPVCSETAAQLLHDGLRDIAFAAAPGAWRLMACARCGCARLDPRPTPQTIGRAYSTYYTHETPAATAPRGVAGLAARLRKILANGYRNQLYGSRLRPSVGPLGAVAGWVLPAARDRVAREAPALLDARPARRGESRLLDVGAGGGRLLNLARSAGWVAMGVELDDAASAVARAQGLEIVASRIEDVPAALDASFDRIVLSHVIEHVYDPAAMLRHCRRLLKPDGVLWLETPNLDSLGHARFGIDWRGLEPPRHLVLFGRGGIDRLLADAGFSRIEHLAPRDMAPLLFEVSARIRAGRLLGTNRQADLDAATRASVARDAQAASRQMQREPARAEYITVQARP